MHQRILVPLDGSQLAETALTHVVPLAQRFTASVTLLQVVAEAKPGTIEDYLRGAAQGLHDQGISVAIEYPEGGPSTVIIDRAGQLGIDLIAMTSHGRGGLERAVFGSVADEVPRKTPCPVLLVRVVDRPPEPDDPQRPAFPYA
ncbi:MAG TPA: universal stress protein [Chloroflexota bacterium]|nr:universal stress protein [Chloroflexota bacterium]